MEPTQAHNRNAIKLFLRGSLADRGSIPYETDMEMNLIYPWMPLTKGFAEISAAVVPSRDALIAAASAALTYCFGFRGLDELSEIDPQRAAALALAATFDPDYDLRDAAIDTLSELLPVVAFSRAQAFIAEPESLRMSAVPALANSNPVAAYPLLKRLAHSAHSMLRDYATSYIDRIERGEMKPTPHKFSAADSERLSRLGLLAAQSLFHSDSGLRADCLIELQRADEILAMSVSTAVAMRQFSAERTAQALDHLVAHAPFIARTLAEEFTYYADAAMQREGIRVLKKLDARP